MSFEAKKKPSSSAYQYGLYLLSGQDYSEFKIRQKLKSKNYEATEIDEAVEKLKEKNYLREAEYKRLLAKKWIRKGYADGMIKRRGSQEHLDFDTVELAQLRDEENSSGADVLAALATKKLRGKTIPEDRNEKQKLRDKIYRALLSKGFGYDEVKRAVDSALQAMQD